MDTETSTARAEQACTGPFSLNKIRVGNCDKLGNRICEILWCGSDYAVYRSEKGVYVHFSDCPTREKEQRNAFAEVAPELCELRYFTHEMQQTSHRALFDHNIAQALMLVMENKLEPAKAIAKAALTMAVRRSTNDNTIRYVRTCLYTAIGLVAILGLVIIGLQSKLNDYPVLFACFIASIFGTVGAAFSIITRVEAFEMKPCQQSNMNYWMSGIRIGIGTIGGVMMLLLAATLLANEPITAALASKPPTPDTWKVAAVIGFLGGFSERLVKSLLRRTGDAVIPASGTPVQEARRAEYDASAARVRSGHIKPFPEKPIGDHALVVAGPAAKA